MSAKPAFWQEVIGIMQCIIRIMVPEVPVNKRCFCHTGRWLYLRHFLRCRLLLCSNPDIGIQKPLWYITGCQRFTSHSVVKVKGRYHFVAASCQPMFEYPITVDHGTVNVSVVSSDQPSEATISVNRVTLFSPTAALKVFAASFFIFGSVID